uniref:GntR family transcriptional regulator n=1 Tax=Pararhizobium sp. IMCC3301 TaxID=3067904 RepID=UPI002741C4ED|nr:GntR family transcriptional regulator [Pararhizobium sp. IMCC3301]
MNSAEAAITLDRRVPVTVQVHALLRQRILRLQLKPGEALSEKELSVQLGVSRTPVREAFIRLSEEGLVDIFPQRGTLVSPIRMEEIKEAQFLRDILETAIVRRAARDIDEASLLQIEANLQRQEISLQQKDYIEFMELDEEFHRLLCQSVSLPRAWRVIHAVKGQLDRVRFMGLPQPGHADLMVRQHGAIFNAIRAGDAELAETEMRTHLQAIWGSIELMTNENSEFFET